MPDDFISLDFKSHLWSLIKYDEVREDLLHYYASCFGRFADDNFDETSQSAYNLKHSAYPSNCFSYATGLIASGNTPADPFYLKDIDFNNKNTQTCIVSNEEYYKVFTPAIETLVSFKEAMSLYNIKSIDQLKTEEYKNYRPVIGLVADRDYHFVKVDFQNTNDNARIILSHRMTKISPSCNTLEEYAQNYNELYGRYYRHPQLLFSPVEFIDRRIHVTKLEKDFFEITLSAKEPA